MKILSDGEKLEKKRIYSHVRVDKGCESVKEGRLMISNISKTHMVSGKNS